MKWIGKFFDWVFAEEHEAASGDGPGKDDPLRCDERRLARIRGRIEAVLKFEKSLYIGPAATLFQAGENKGAIKGLVTALDVFDEEEAPAAVASGRRNDEMRDR